MQVTTLGAQLGLGSELVDCYRDATSVLFGHLLTFFVATYRRSSTIFYKHRINSFEVSSFKLKIVRGVTFDFVDSLKNNGTNYLLIFDDSCGKICNSKAFYNTATAESFAGLSTI